MNKRSIWLDRILRFVSLRLRCWFSEENTHKGKFFIVVSERSTGSRMLKRWLVDYGCVGSKSMKQAWQYTNPTIDDKEVVLKIDFNGRFYQNWVTNFKKMIYLFQKIGYKVIVLHINRDTSAMLKSQVKWGYEKNINEAIYHHERAFFFILKHVKLIGIRNWYEIDYEDFVGEEEYRNNLANQLGLEKPKPEQYKNMNEQYGNRIL